MAARQRQALTGKFIRANDAYQRWAARLAKRRPWLGLPALKLGMTAEVIATSIYTNFNKAVADFEKPPSQRLREMARNFYESFRESLPKKTKAAPETTAAMVREELIDMTKHHPAKTMGAVSASLIYGSGTLLPVLAAWSYATTSGYVGQAAAWSGLTSVTLWHTAVGAATASFYGVLLGTLGMAALTSLAAYGIYKLASSGDFFQLAAGQLTKPYKASERYKDGVFNAMIEGFSMATLVGMVGKFTHAGASTKLGVEAAGVVPAVNKAASDIGSEFARVGMIWGDRARRVRNFLRRTPAVSHDI
ncbi:MAG: hypothetical protein HY053_06525 [Proteobacteria bacterium]|nr:hypothetical protein [Pseudomonadota bacterium]